ncbi:MAG TPA: amidohydrolase family protein [Bryobacteraceae bacterium]|nr:amidohydrolase family protein [Bryobacteraceae bacterium]
MAATPWGEIEIADAHVHFFSPAFFKSLADQKGDPDVASLLGWHCPVTSEDLADRWVAELDRSGVSRAMLIASVPNDTESVGVAVDMYPDRFGAVYMANPLLPSPDIRFETAFTEDGVSGVFLFPAMHRYSLHDNKVWALVQVLAGHPGAVIYVHCGALSLGFRGKLGLPSHFDMRFSNPIDLHALAANFPRVNFVIPHFGAGYFREALMVADLCPNIYFDTSSSNSWMRYQTADLDLAGVFRRALEVVGPKRLLFGSDSSWFPRGWVGNVFDDQVAALRQTAASPETARAILGGNLMRISGPRRTTSIV